VVSARLVVFEVPFSVAVSTTVAFSELLSTAENWAVAEPASTFTDPGTTTAVLLLLNATAVAAVAAALSVTVQVLDDAPESDVGLHMSAVSVGAAVVVKVRVVVFETPLRAAVTVTVALVDPPLVAVNWAVVAPAATLTDAGSVTAVLLLVKVMAVAAVAAALSVTVQVLDDAPVSDAGVHATALRIGTAEVVTVTVPPVANRGTAVPVGVDVSPVAIVRADVWVAVTATVATTPSAMAVAFMPSAIHVYVPLPWLQVSVFPAPVSAAPAVAEMAVTPAGY